MNKSMFFLVTEEVFNQGTEEEFIGYTIGGKQFAKGIFQPIAEEAGKAVVLARPKNDAQFNWASQQPEYLAPEYQHMLIDALLGIIPSKIVKKIHDVSYTDGEDRVRTSVWDWEQAGMPGSGTHRYHKRRKILGVEVE